MPPATRAPRSSPVACGSRRGLGLTNRFIIDQHFRQRDRLGRLLTALPTTRSRSASGSTRTPPPSSVPTDTLEVEGSGGVTIVDAADVSFSSIDDAGEGQPVCMLGLRLHFLVAGATFNLHTRTASAGALAQAKE